MTIYEHVTTSHDLLQCTQTSNNLNNAPEHFSVHVTSPCLTKGHVKH